MRTSILGFVAFKPRLVAVPFFFFNQSMTQSISPAYANWGLGSDEYSSTGFPYVAFTLEKISFPVGRLFGLNGFRLGGELSVELSKQDMKFITPKTTAYEWTLTDATVTATTFYYLAKIGYSFSNGSSIDLGIGQRRIWNAQEGEATTKTTKPIYSISYELHK